MLRPTARIENMESQYQTVIARLDSLAAKPSYATTDHPNICDLLDQIDGRINDLPKTLGDLSV